MIMSPQQKMTKSRANLVMMQPFFGALALRLKVVEDPAIQTASCDGSTLAFNPKFVNELTVSQCTGLIAHEVMHAALMHHTRRGDRSPKRWNVACDHAVNNILKKSGFDLPSGRYADPAYDGASAEHIYTLLPEDQNDNNGDGGSGGGNENSDPGGDGGVQDSPNSQNNGASASQQNAEETEWKVAVAQAAHVAKQAGRLPAGMERLIEELLEPQLPWRSILRRFMTERANDDFSWKRGNRRFVAQGLYLPSRESEGSGEMVVVIDTSGSIGQKELTEFGNEIKGIVEDVRPSKTYVMYCDASVAHVDEFKPEDKLEFAAHGGGGTDFRPPFEWLEERHIQPKALVYLTDGYGPFPEEPASFPTMWVINNDRVSPPHGEHLVLEV